MIAAIATAATALIRPGLLASASGRAGRCLTARDMATDAEGEGRYHTTAHASGARLADGGDRSHYII